MCESDIQLDHQRQGTINSSIAGAAEERSASGEQDRAKAGDVNEEWKPSDMRKV